jgi:branched-chain amino acid aminotransferase
MTAFVNVNGRISDEREAVIPVLDHGFLYGEGVYETLRTYNERPFLLDRHLRRLRKSAEMINLGVPLTDDQFDARIAETGRTAATRLGGRSSEWYIRVLLTRGVGELTYDPAACPTPSVVIIVKPFEAPRPEAYEEGVAVALVSVVRNHPGSVNPLIKSNNLLNNALAMQEAFRRGAFEGVMRNYRGELSECTTSNVFVVKGGQALTPPLESGLLAGITREFVFELGLAEGIPVRDAVLRDNDLFDADEAFLTSTTRELLPITRVDDRVIGSGRLGPVTRKLLEAFRRQAQMLTRSVGSGQWAVGSESPAGPPR